jgi:phosphoribosyl 1,2-cyclic phosphodiesterase
MKLHIVGTGSKGNCYILEGKTSTLIIECGMPFMDVKKSLDFKIENIVGAICSHSHGDHFKFNNDFAGGSINVYAGKETNLPNLPNQCNRFVIENKKSFIVGEFTIMPFDVEHDVPTFGFLIHHPECGNVLFLTDTVYCKYKFPPLNQVIIEANYSDLIIDGKYRHGGNKFVRDRVLNSHMEIQETIVTLRNQDLRNCANIVLIHLSDRNSDEKEFKKIVQSVTGKNVTVASNGMIINFDKTAF